MQDDIKKAITALTARASKTNVSADALRYTQAALNLTHVQSMILGIKGTGKG